jgi:hypothetical protein
MRNLLKRASYLFWQYPVPWLPVLAADVLKFWVVASGHRLSHILTLAMLPHSVLTVWLSNDEHFFGNRLIHLGHEFLWCCVLLLGLGDTRKGSICSICHS